MLPHTVECMVDDVKDDVLRTESKVEDLKEELVTVKSEICLSAPITPPVVMSKCTQVLRTFII